MSNPLARAMRQRMTDAEVRLWVNLRGLRQRGLAFRRQSPVGRYILDFECRRAKLGVEVDGAQHDQAEARVYDAERDAWLATQGYLMLRFENYYVLTRTDEIVQQIVRLADERAAALRKA